MKLIGLMPVRNEAWCLGLTLRAALRWCDEMVVLLHACTDESLRIVEDVDPDGERVNVIDAVGAWDEMKHRQRMLDTARADGATHIAIVDADEIVTGNMLQKTIPSEGYYFDLRDVISNTTLGSCLQLPMYQLRGSLDRYHSNGIWGNRWLSVAFADDPKLSWSGDKFHDREPRYPDGSKLRPYQPITQGKGGSMHLWGVSERRLRARHAAYKCIERLRWPSKPTIEIEQMYNLWRSPSDCVAMYPQMPEWGQPWTFANVPLEWWAPYEHLESDLIENLDLHAEPWQIAEVQRLVAEHGAETFKGLDLFDCVKLAPNARLPVESAP